MHEHSWKSYRGGKEIYHSTVIIVGLGDLGYELAKRLKAFECKTIGIKGMFLQYLGILMNYIRLINLKKSYPMVTLSFHVYLNLQNH